MMKTNTAAGLLGSIKTPRKARSSAANGRKAAGSKAIYITLNGGASMFFSPARALAFAHAHAGEGCAVYCADATVTRKITLALEAGSPKGR